MIWMNPDGTYAGLKVDYYQDGDVGVLVGAPGVIRVLTAGEDHEEIYRTFIGKRQTE